ncbi:MAG: response regulator [bacterium]
MINLSLNEQLEVIEQLLKMTTRREAEIAQLKTQLEVYQSFDVDEEVFKDDGRLGKILLLFSSRTIKDILQMMLERTGLYEVKTIDDLEDIPSAFALFSPDVCIIEHGSGNMSGKTLEILSGLRARSSKVGLISVLSENDVNIIREIVTTGVDDFLVKPIDTRRLRNVILDIMRKRGTRKAG